MNLKNEKKWNEYVSKNKDPYGKACVKVARQVMQELDKDSTPLKPGYNPKKHTAHYMICRADRKTKAGGITGFMAQCVCQMIYVCHKRGAEFKKSFNFDK